MKEKMMELATECMDREFYNPVLEERHHFYDRAMELFEKEVYCHEFGKYYYGIYQGKVQFRLPIGTKLLHKYIYDIYNNTNMYGRILSDYRAISNGEKYYTAEPLSVEQLDKICDDYEQARREADLIKKQLKKSYNNSTTKAKFKIAYHAALGAGTTYLADNITVEEAYGAFETWIKEEYKSVEATYASLVMKFNGREVVIGEK